MRFLPPTRTLTRSPGAPRLRATAALLGLALALLPGLGRATSLELEGTADLADKSDTIVTGTVVGIEARMHAEHQFIYTYVTIETDEVLKGSVVSAGQTIVLQELGGRIDRLIHHVEAVPEFEIGERVLAFLEDRDDDLFRTYGMIQGKFRFETDARSGEEVLTRPAEWTDAYFAAFSTPQDLTAMKVDGSYAAQPLLTAIRERVVFNR